MSLTTNLIRGGVEQSTPQKFMKIKILKNTVADNKHVKAGDVIEISHLHAQDLIAYGKAETTTAKTTASKKNRSVNVEELEERDGN